MAHYSIRDLERLTGIKAHTIRIWEKRYGLIEPARTSTNIREYCDAEVRTLLNISILNKNGYKISRIANFTAEEIATNVNLLTESSSDTESFLENLIISMIELDEQKFEKILSRAIIQLGFEEAIIRIIMPFFTRIGVMWQTGTINPAQEHFVSHLIRQKLMVAIDSQITGESERSRRFILFLPEGEQHELGLLLANYMLRKRGHKVIYLGPDVPLHDVKEIDRIRPFDYLYTSFVTSLTCCDIINYLKDLTELFPDKQVFVTGFQALQIKEKLPESIQILDSPLDLAEVLKQFEKD